jgi:hypothetical protein
VRHGSCIDPKGTTMDLNRFTEKMQEAVRTAQSLAIRRSHQQLDVEHVLAALLEQENGPVAAPAPVAVLASTSSADRDAPAQLPHTASSLPRLALIGVLLLAVGLGLQARVRRAR